MLMYVCMYIYIYIYIYIIHTYIYVVCVQARVLFMCYVVFILEAARAWVQQPGESSEPTQWSSVRASVRGSRGKGFQHLSKWYIVVSQFIMVRNCKQLREIFWTYPCNSRWLSRCTSRCNSRCSSICNSRCNSRCDSRCNSRARTETESCYCARHCEQKPCNKKYNNSTVDQLGSHATRPDMQRSPAPRLDMPRPASDTRIGQPNGDAWAPHDFHQHACCL